MKHLIPMIDFVDNIEELVSRETGQDFDFWIYNQFSAVQRYAKFLKQPLTLGMFFPCDENNNPLEEPKVMEFDIADYIAEEFHYNKIKQYQKAKSKGLFKNIELINLLDNAYIFKIDDWEFSFSNTKPHAMILTERRSICSIEQLANYVNDFGIRLELTESAIKQIGL